MMFLPRFHCDDRQLLMNGGPMPEGMARHAIRALRLGVGDRLCLFDGQGGEFETRIVERRGDRIELEAGTHRPVERESPIQVVLVQALCVHDKMDWVIQKSVELGVVAIQPLEASRSVLRLSGERALRRQQHWQRIVLSACEQSGRNRIPPVHSIQTLTAWLGSGSMAGGYWLDPDAGLSLASIPCPTGPLPVVVGPEGGFDEPERHLLERFGFQGVRAGPRVMRTETAGIAVLAAIQTLWGDFRDYNSAP